MSYDDWKTTEPDDRYTLGDDPADRDHDDDEEPEIPEDPEDPGPTDVIPYDYDWAEDF
jgi:hypothetical protein